MEYQIRKAKQSDLAALADVEACCFPVSEAASKEAIQKRLETFGDYWFHQWLCDRPDYHL